MKKTATITFHASHNYGSMLQAYALQQTLLSLGVENEIINLRTSRQKKYYSNPTSSTGKSWKHKIWRIIREHLFPNSNSQLINKYSLFENFLKDQLILTSEYESSTELKNSLSEYDYYITGSDQCWNTQCLDFDSAYLLDFTDSHNKIAYAASIGPFPLSQLGENYNSMLKCFRVISAREEGTSDVISKIVNKEIEIVPDPTILLPRLSWQYLAGSSPIIDEPYIFLYTPYIKDDIFEIAIEISKREQLPIIVSNFTSPFKDYFLLKRNGAVFKLDIGPVEFINLIANAKTVISGSFHALVFSMIFHTPFWAVNGDRDNRMRHILNKYDFLERVIHIDNISEKLASQSISFDYSDAIIEKEKDFGISFLKHNLDIYA
ncbi:polysaccharide pyruvyl transferase family protein [Muribaculum intestinale]|uniref:polysaccharide pyruvyl transferase family protein n=1 Tax=Muribaculum intestinale TaxID=1796646 RepID=UPI0025A9B9C5|nr:polysaccharide pyruvyl transferase family protein [Muribaculum intestinale]